MQLNWHTVLIFLALGNLLMALPMLLRLRQPTSMILWAIKIFTSSLSPLLFLLGLFLVVLGWITNTNAAAILGGFGSLLFAWHIFKVTRPPNPSTGFEKVFGRQYEALIPKDRKVHFLSRRYSFWLPKSKDTTFVADIPFHTYQDSERQLLCDIWQPPKNIKPSGLAFIYLHGSAWSVSDKDSGTRKFFRRLASQGHLIMDVAYRLFPETNFMGMVNDAQYAIAWMKAHSATYNINPDQIVIGGGSAGGHLALLTAYTSNDSSFLPKGLEASDVGVCGVVSLYGPTDLVATYYHTAQDIIGKKKSLKTKKEDVFNMPPWVQKRMGNQIHRLGFDKDVDPGMLAPMLGGTPTEKPEAYAQFSPITHVHKGCPKTMLVQGEYDIIVSAKATRELYKRLTAKGVSTVLHLIPQTDHAFDLVLPRISPSAHNGIYDVERFLSLLLAEGHA